MSRQVLDGTLVFVTGAAGLLGREFCRSLVHSGAGVVALDIDHVGLEHMEREFGGHDFTSLVCDITNEHEFESAIAHAVFRDGRRLALVNNAAINPRAESDLSGFVRIENLTLEQWNHEISVGLTGALIASRSLGVHMANRGTGTILNISSDHGVMAPNQNLYGGPDSDEVKPVTYSVIKHGLIGLTRYLATYWAHRGVTVNALCPGGVSNGQADDFRYRFQELVPLRRMAEAPEISGPLVFLLSPAASYMTGSIVHVDGGRTVW